MLLTAEARCLETREHRAAFAIGGLSLGLRGECPLPLAPQLADFACDETNCDIELQVEWAAAIRPSRGALLFESGSLWQLREEREALVFEFTSPVLGPAPYKQVRMDREISRGRVILHAGLLDAATANPLEYPLDELLFVHRLARGGGAEVHGVGLVDGAGMSHLFIGHSGAGKSTTARLWHEHGGARVLSDDRIVLRRAGSGIRMFGTPWHGDAGLARAESAPLHSLLVLEHGTENAIEPLLPAQAVTEIFARSFVPFHAAEALQRTLQFLEDVVRVVPCYRFRFAPDARAVRKVLDFSC